MKTRIASLLILIIMLSACTSDNAFDKGKRQLEQQGYSDIKSTGYDWFCCSDKDTFSNGFTAKDSKGNVVEGCICSGILKGVTVRFE
jgi:hypothetical protein